MKIEIFDLCLISKELTKYNSIFKDNHLFVTGGTGFFGKWILEAINFLNDTKNLNIQLTLLSRDPERFKIANPHLCYSDKINFIKGDVRSFEFPENKFDYIIHAATDASATLNKENPKLMRSTIMDGATHIEKFSKHTHCKKILYISSGAAYGPQPFNIKEMSENFIDNPNFNYNDAYASAKLESEQYLKQSLKCELVIARCFSFSGPHLPLNGTYAFGNFINNRINNENIEILSTGQSLRSYLYAADLVIWLFTILFNGKDRNIYNVGSDECISIEQLAKKIAGTDVSVNFGNNRKMNYYIPDIKKCKEELGLRVYTSLDDSIKKTLEYYK